MRKVVLTDLQILILKYVHRETADQIGIAIGQNRRVVAAQLAELQAQHIVERMDDSSPWSFKLAENVKLQTIAIFTEE